MLDRINRVVLALASSLLMAGLVAAVGIRFWEAETVIRVGRLAKPWMLLTLALGALPVLARSACGVVHLFRRRRPLWGGVAASAWLIVTANLLFWGLVQAQFAPIKRLFEKGRVVWVGQRAFLFGHGYWKVSEGYWQHQTLVRLPDGSLYRGPTLELLAQLRHRGASTVWGSWCYTGNYPYIRKDLISGKRIAWPSYASYNRTPGLTIPIWLGSTFVRVGWPEGRYLSEPATLGPVTPDTVLLRDPFTDPTERIVARMQQRLPGLPHPDSVSWQPIAPDTVYAMSRVALAALAPEERRNMRKRLYAALEEKMRTGLALYWIRGRAFPVYIRIPARLQRTLDLPQYAHRDEGPGRWDLPGEG